MIYFSIDLETTGLNPEENQIIEFAAVMDDLKNPKPIEGLPYFHTYITHEKYTGNPFALSLHGEIFKRINEKDSSFEYTDAYELGARFKFFLLKHMDFDGKRPRINVAGKNFGSFDLQFLKKTSLLSQVDIGHRFLDPSMLYMTKEDKVLPSTEECLKRIGKTPSGLHKALDDAKDVIELIRAKFL